MGSVGLFYGSNGGVTENVAGDIASAFERKGFVVDVYDIGKSGRDSFDKYDKIIIGTSTWGMGDLQDDWDSFSGKLSGIDFSGKKVAFFGTGDQYSYPETFVDGIGILYEAVSAAGADVVGGWSAEGYDFEESKAFINGQFVGLVLDEDNQPDMTKQRIADWVDIVVSSL
jgi:flavodoxin I